MIFNMYIQVNNEYSDSAIDKTCKYKVRINCNNFVSDRNGYVGLLVLHLLPLLNPWLIVEM